MVRTIQEEIELRKQQREAYFEDPSYRKWSDIVYTDSTYGNWSEKGFLAAYLLGDCDSYIDLSRMCELFTNGKQLPINWKAIYDYYDERYNDDDNRLRDEWFHGLHNPGDVVNSQSIKAILEKFRDELVGDYDMI